MGMGSVPWFHGINTLKFVTTNLDNCRHRGIFCQGLTEAANALDGLMGIFRLACIPFCLPVGSMGKHFSNPVNSTSLTGDSNLLTGQLFLRFSGKSCFFLVQYGYGEFPLFLYAVNCSINLLNTSGNELLMEFCHLPSDYNIRMWEYLINGL